MMVLLDVIVVYIILSDQEFSRLVEGDPEILTRLYEEYKQNVYDFLIIKLKGNQEIAKDILSETFEAVITSVSRLSSQKNLCGWLISIAYKKLCNFYRRTRQENKIIDFKRETLGEREVELNERMEKDYRFYLIRNAMERIKPDYRTMMKMKYVEGLTAKQISRQTGKSEGAVELLIHRAKKKLKKEIHRLDQSYFKGEI